MGIRFITLVLLLLVTQFALADDRHQARRPLTQVPSVSPGTTSGIEPPPENDTTFVINTGTGLDTGCTFRSGGPLRITVNIPRRFSRKIGDLVQAGGLGATARLFFPAFDVDFDGGSASVQPERDRVSLNGEAIDNAAGVGPFLNGFNDVYYLNEFNVPVDKLKFADSNGEGQNILQIDIDTLNTTETWCTSVDWVAIRIDAPPPALLLHGFMSDGPGAWGGGGVLQGLNIDGIENSGTDISNGGFDSIADNAGDVQANIDQYKQQFGVKRVQLIAHSKGGLDARGYIESGAYRDDVVRLIQIGTPNNGSPAADIGTVLQFWLGGLLASALDRALEDLSVAHMAYFNSTHDENVAVPVISFGAINTQPLGSCLLSFLTPLLGDNDGIVPITSAHGLPYATKLGPLTSATNDSCHTGMSKSTLVYDNYVRSFARSTDSLQGSGGQPQLIRTQQLRAVAGAESGNTGAVMLAQSMTSLAPGAETELDFTLAGAGGEAFAVAIPDALAQYDLSLRLPNGDVVTPASGSGATLGDFGLGSHGIVQGMVTSTQAGTARLIVRATRATAMRKLVLSAFPASTADAAFLYSTPEIGVKHSDTALRLSFTRNGTALPLASGTLTVTYADARQQTITLVGDAGDLTGQFRPDAVGSVLLTFTATLASGGTRVTNVEFGVIDPAVTLSSPTATPITTEDSNGNNLIDSLLIPITLTAPAAGNYDVTGELRTATGKKVIGRVRLTAAAAGQVSGLLRYPGSEIYLTGENGPYILTQATALRGDTGQVVGDNSLSRATSAFAFSGFEHNAVQVNGIAGFEPVDSNGTPGAEAIDVSINVTADIAGSYTYSARLSSLFGDELSFQQQTQALVAGTNIVKLRFATNEITRRNLPPPFVVEGFLIFGAGSSAIGNVVGTINGPETSTLEGYIPCTLTVSSNTVSFPDTAVGTTANATIILTATGNSCTVVSAGVAPPFAIAPVTLPFQIAKDSNVPLGLSYAPVASGTSSKPLSIVTNDAIVPTKTVAVTGASPAPSVPSGGGGGSAAPLSIVVLVAMTILRHRRRR